jgi:hypothetical protein
MNDSPQVSDSDPSSGMLHLKISNPQDVNVRPECIHFPLTLLVIGGGNHPIVGCVSGVQEARHHGPDKSTSNNEEGNVHRICHRCHNRWHAANNEDYDWNSTLVNSHSPRPQTDDERQQAILDELVYHGSKQTPVRD